MMKKIVLLAVVSTIITGCVVSVSDYVMVTEETPCATEFEVLSAAMLNEASQYLDCLPATASISATVDFQPLSTMTSGTMTTGAAMGGQPCTASCN